jgi:hypothetical protein
MNRKCNHGAEPFTFEMPLTSNGLFIGNLLVEGFGCKQNGKCNADIDNVFYNNVEIKPVLEVLGGMAAIDAAAENHVQSMFEPVKELAVA